MVCDAVRNYLEESNNRKLVLFTKKMNHRKNSFLLFKQLININSSLCC